MEGLPPDFLPGSVESRNSMRLSLKSSTGVADPRDMKRGISCPRQNVQPIPGCPILRVFCEGWDTTNLDTDRRVSHPLQRTQRMGHPPFRGASCRAKHQPRLHREIVSSRKAAHANMAGAAYRKFGSPRLFRPTYASANVGHPQLLRQHRWWCSTGANPLRRQGGQRIFNRGSSPGCNVVPPDLMEL
jgi:hypothetical protein